MIRTVGLLVFVCKITSRQFEPKNTLNLCCYLKLRRVARREHDSRGRALPQGGNMPFSPRRIDHDVGGKATRYPVQESERMVVEELGPGYAHAGGYPRSVVVGRALISNARQHVLHFVRVETGRIGQDGTKARANVGVVNDCQRALFSHCLHLDGPNTKVELSNRHQAPHVAPFAEDSRKWLLCKTQYDCCTLLCYTLAPLTENTSSEQGFTLVSRRP